MNDLKLMGNLGKDPELKTAGNGNSFCTFSVATSETWKDKTSGEKVVKTQWHNCISYGKQAEIIAQYFKKGSKILLSGMVEYSEKDGKYFTNIKVKEFHFVDSKSDTQQTATPQPKKEVSIAESMDDSLPF